MQLHRRAVVALCFATSALTTPVLASAAESPRAAHALGAIAAIAVDPHDGNVVLVGEASGRVLRSTDAGVTWSAVSLPAPVMRAYKIQFSPVDGKRVALRSYEGLFLSEDQGATWHAVARRDPDWPSLVLDPVDPLRIWLMTSVNENEDDESYLYTSTDWGQTWTTALRLEGTGAEAVLVTPAKIYIGTQRQDFDTMGRSGVQTVGRAPHGFFSSALVQDPTASATLYGGGVYGVMKSSDGGATWQDANVGMEFSQISTLVFDPAKPTHLLAAASDDATSPAHGRTLFLSTDGAKTWKVLSNGVAESGVVDLAVGGPRGRTLFVATQSEGVVTLDLDTFR